uniref:Poly [ADP-ribose] polymerase n=2 Tax=Clytia hemisphaerica TaxID=252671 RepID=A0A7M5WWV7_9CNID
MKLFHISDTSLLKKSLVYFKPKSEEKKKQEFLQQPTFNFLKDEAICVEYVDDVCDKDETCSFLHPKNRTPYLWQYKKPIETSWKSFPNNLNVEIEKAFCDPMQSRYDFADKASYITFDESSKITAFYMNQNVEVRRLSTRTSLCMPKGSYTTWKWYWKENSGKWTEYTGKVSPGDLEYDFVYQNQSTHKTFTIGEYNYKLDFTTMQQHNLGPVYFTKRNVIRRPVFVSTSSTPQEEDITPWHWPKEVSLEGGRLDVEPTKKQQITQQFKTSLARNMTVLDVEEICNAEFYQKYQSKKKILAKKLGENNVNELELYHGTDAAVVDGICKQNFDWRLNGKNATMFGQGSYFATQASYSRNFTRPDSNKIKYMFVAKVLAGRYTKGSSDIKRPPPISPLDPHTLYDSCVDNISSPSMYIVFERDQCYPQYLITFLEDDENLALRGNRYSVDFDQSALRRQKQAINSLSYKHKLKPLNERPRRSVAAASNVLNLTEDSSFSPSTNVPSYTTSSHQTSPKYSKAQTQPKANKKDGCIIS